MNLPKLKKKISSFLTKEDGKITKTSLIKAGILLSSAAIASLKTASAACPPVTTSHDDHCNNLVVQFTKPIAKATHTDGHGNHGNGGDGGHCNSFLGKVCA